MRLRKKLTAPWGGDLIEEPVYTQLWKAVRTLMFENPNYTLSHALAIELMSVMFANIEHGDVLNLDGSVFDYVDVYEVWGEKAARRNFSNYLRAMPDQVTAARRCRRPERLRVLWIYTHIHAEFCEHIELPVARVASVSVRL